MAAVTTPPADHPPASRLPHPGNPAISPRVRAFTLYCHGMTSPAIAERLGVSERTIRRWLAAWEGYERERALDEAVLAGQFDRLRRRAVRTAAHSASMSRAATTWQDADDEGDTADARSGASMTLEEYTQPAGSHLSVRYLALAHAAQKEIARLHRLYEQSLPPQLPPGRLIVTRRPDPDPAPAPAPNPPDEPPDDPPNDAEPDAPDDPTQPPDAPALPRGSDCSGDSDSPDYSVGSEAPADLSGPSLTVPAAPPALAARFPTPTPAATVRRTSTFSTRTLSSFPPHPEFMRSRTLSALSARVRKCPPAAQRARVWAQSGRKAQRGDRG